jgi:hypothetical protein
LPLRPRAGIDEPAAAVLRFASSRPARVPARTGARQIRVLALADNRYGVYLEATGNKVKDAVITVYSDHALTAADSCCSSEDREVS